MLFPFLFDCSHSHTSIVQIYKKPPWLIERIPSNEDPGGFFIQSYGKEALCDSFVGIDGGDCPVDALPDSEIIEDFRNASVVRRGGKLRLREQKIGVGHEIISISVRKSASAFLLCSRIQCHHDSYEGNRLLQILN